MQTHGFLQYAVVLLLAAVIAVPLARRWQLGAVLGYLGAGALIGPSGVRLLNNTEQISQLSELGVVLMLFVIGLELSPQRLWVMRRTVFGIGTLQLVATAIVIGGIAFALGIDWKGAMIVGLGLALSSTAIDLQILAERKELSTAHGRLAFAILLFQDVAAIPILALIPALAVAQPMTNPGAGALMALRVILTIAAVVVGGRYLLRPMFRAAARVGAPEMFTATALLVVIGTAWIMDLVGMSMSLGAFIAGVLLADSEYRHEIEAQIEPFKGLLLGLFFISVGMSLDVDLIMREPQLVGTLLVAMLVVKAILLYAISRFASREDNAQSIALAAILAQGSEFAFVVFTLAASNSLIDPAQRDLLILIVTLSMVATPLMVRLRVELKPLDKKAKPSREFDRLDGATPRVIVAGFGRVGQIVTRLLASHRIPFTALERDAEQVDFVRHFGSTVFYGDATRLDLLRAAQTDKAEIFVIATEDPEANLRTARLLKRHFPNLKVFARARNRQHVFRLMDLNVDAIVRDTFYSSLELARHVLEALGYDPKTAEEHLQRFREHDERVLLNQYPVYDDDAALLQTAKEARADLQRLFEVDSGEEEESA
ncbi:MAG TPA: monovalent cation:proton antiporter-2 (CPA2) family protein [Rhodanobacteraceae bacterium]|nr:monovalent cation:proton antiporter-2 (CPA2) family protein [Rhodanobacteraceae bacterium]